MEYKDYYKILDVPKTASAEEIKKAYRKLIRKYHPDVSKESNASDKTAEINEAYAVLSDTEKRQAYDTLGQDMHAAQGQQFRPPPGWESQFDFSNSDEAYAGAYSDFFEQLFGRAARANRTKHSGTQHYDSHMAMRGSDQHAQIELSIADAYHGTEQVLTLYKAEIDDQGYVTNKEYKTHVKIPKGVFEGQHIRLAGKGNPGIGGAPAGDLLLEVKFKSDKRWHTDKRDVYQRLPLSPWEAALGKNIEVLTPAGKKRVTIPAGSKTGSKLRLKDLGIPAPPPGHLYLELEIVQPQVKTNEERQAYEALEKLYPHFNPRHDIGV